MYGECMYVYGVLNIPYGVYVYVCACVGLFVSLVHPFSKILSELTIHTYSYIHIHFHTLYATYTDTKHTYSHRKKKRTSQTPPSTTYPQLPCVVGTSMLDTVFFSSFQQQRRCNILTTSQVIIQDMMIYRSIDFVYQDRHYPTTATCVCARIINTMRQLYLCL